jgi:hypothetical protein
MAGAKAPVARTCYAERNFGGAVSGGRLTERVCAEQRSSRAPEMSCTAGWKTFPTAAADIAHAIEQLAMSVPPQHPPSAAALTVAQSAAAACPEATGRPAMSANATIEANSLRSLMVPRAG